MGVRVKLRSKVVVGLVIGALSVMGTSSAFAGKNNGHGNSKDANKNAAMASQAVTCSPTNAKGHAAKAVQPPVVKRPFVNRIFTLNTNCGQIVIAADGKSAPLTVLAMTALAKGGFFDQSLCHRLTTSGLYVLQCGDPSATGSGGPAFSYPDENLPQYAQNDYPAGIVAMANSGANTNGSQFFLVYQDTTLPPSYTRWGVITKGLNILKTIAAAGVVGGGTDGTPNQAIAINSISVR